MTEAREAFFENHPDAMWIYDRQTLRFLDVNRAAVARYGYSRDEFLAMTIADIRPAEDRDALWQNVRNTTDAFQESSMWRHRLKSGRIIHVNVASHAFDFDGTDARLVSVRDLTPLFEADQEKEELLARESRARREAEAASQHFQALFEAVPGQFFVLSRDGFEITAVTDTCLRLTNTERHEIKGRKLFDIFPPPPDEPDFDGTELVRASFLKVLDTGQTDAMATIRYPIMDRASGKFEERYWRPINMPLRGPDGEVDFIVCHVNDVTESLRRPATGLRPAAPRAQPEITPLALDLQLRTGELDLARRQLKKREATLKNAQRLARLGHWELDLNTGRAHWSPELYDLFGVSPTTFGNARDEFLALVHPDDRARYVETQEAAIREKHGFEVEFRARGAGGTERIMREIGEVVEIGQRPVLSVLTQDITDIRRIEKRAEQMSDLLRLAGRMVRLGSWRVDLEPLGVTWGEGTDIIHDMPGLKAPSLEESFEFYVPEHRGRLRAAFQAAVMDGTPYDETLQIVSATGRRKWVRAIGEPERGADGAIRCVRGALQDVSELVFMRDEAKAVSERLMQTLENISDGFMTLDSDWCFRYLNSRAEEILGRSAETLIGRNVWTEFPETAGTRFKREYETAIREARTVRFVAHVPAPLDGWFEVNAYPTDDGLAVYFRDVTDARKTQEHLRLLDAAVSRQNDILLITEGQQIDAPDGPRIVYVNDAIEAITGYKRDEVIGKTPRILQGPNTQRAELDRIRQAISAGRSVRSELRNYRKDGTEFWLEVEITPLLDEDGRPAHFVAVERDISARKAQELALLESQERFRLLSLATHDVIWDWDATTDMMWWNENMQTTFGYDRTPVPRSPEAWERRVHPDDRARVADAFQQTIDGAGSTWQSEYRYLRADGSVAHVMDRGFIMRDAKGKPARVLGCMTDVSERKQTEERLRQSQKLEAIGQLTGGVTHDMNNLLTIIMGNSEILSGRLVDRPELRSMVEDTLSAAERGAELGQRLLAISRQQPLQPRMINANHLIAGVKGLLKRTLERNIDLEICPAVEPCIIEADPVQLELAILNIVLNARDAMVDGGRLVIETGRVNLDHSVNSSNIDVDPGDYVVISVSDTGPGMTPEVREKAFEPFFTTKATGKGTGLGLSMVFGFAKQSGGHARIYSEPGVGTTVRIYLPCAGETEIPVPDSPAQPRVRGGAEHILVVEDDAAVRKHLVAQLRDQGYRVTPSGTGPGALEILQDMGDIDLLFTDIVMPGGLNGRQLADAALAQRPDLKILFTSGYTENVILHHGRLDEGIHFLGKPYRRDDLLAKVREVLDLPG